MEESTTSEISSSEITPTQERSLSTGHSSFIAIPVQVDNEPGIAILQANDSWDPSGVERVGSPGIETSEFETPFTTVPSIAIFNTTTLVRCDTNQTGSTEFCGIRNDKLVPREPDVVINYESPPQFHAGPTSMPESDGRAIEWNLTDSTGRTIASGVLGATASPDGEMVMYTKSISFDGGPETRTECSPSQDSPTESCTVSTTNMPPDAWAMSPTNAPERPADTGVNAANLVLDDAFRSPTAAPNSGMGFFVASISNPNFMLGVIYSAALNNVDDRPKIDEEQWPGDQIIRLMPVSPFVPQDPTYPDDLPDQTDGFPANDSARPANGVPALQIDTDTTESESTVAKSSRNEPLAPDEDISSSEHTEVRDDSRKITSSETDDNDVTSSSTRQRDTISISDENRDSDTDHTIHRAVDDSGMNAEKEMPMASTEEATNESASADGLSPDPSTTPTVGNGPGFTALATLTVLISGCLLFIRRNTPS